MTGESPEQERQNIIDRYEREQAIYEKSYEDSVHLLNRSLEAKDLAGIDLARKNMGEASEILGDLVKQKNEALNELQVAENASQALAEDKLNNIAEKDASVEQNEKQEESEDQDYYNGLGM